MASPHIQESMYRTILTRKLFSWFVLAVFIFSSIGLRPAAVVHAAPEVRLWINLNEDTITGSGFTGESVVVEIFSSEGGANLYTGSVGLNSGEFGLQVRQNPEILLSLQPGYFIRVTGDSEVETLTIMDLYIDRVDYANDRVYGYAPANSTVTVCGNLACSELFVEVTANENGSWQASFPQGSIQPVFPEEVMVFIQNEDSDVVHVIGDDRPVIEAYFTWDFFNLYNFSPERDVQVQIFNPDQSTAWEGTVHTDGSGSVLNYRIPNFRYAEGMELRVTDPIIGVKSLDVTAIRVSGSDPGNGSISGVVHLRPDHTTDVRFEWIDINDAHSWALQPVSPVDNTWSFNEAAFEMDFGSVKHFRASVFEADGDRTSAGAEAGPGANVKLGDNYLFGWNWTPGATVNVEIFDHEGGEQIGGNANLPVDPFGSIGGGMNELGVDFDPGMFVRISENYYPVISESGTLAPLLMETIDWENNVVTGRTNPDTNVVVSVQRVNEGLGDMSTISDENGIWTLDFDDRMIYPDGSMELTSAPIDLERGMWLEAFTQAGNINSGIHFSGPMRILVYNPWNSIDLENFLGYSQVDVLILHSGGESYSETVTLNGSGNCYNCLEGRGSAFAGDTVRVSDPSNGSVLKELTVQPLRMTAMDWTARSMAGMADPDQPLFVYARGVQWNEWNEKPVTAGENGSWAVDFSDTDLEVNESSWAYAYIRDVDGDETRAEYRAPHVEVTMEPWDSIWGDGYSPNVEITIEVSGGGLSETQVLHTLTDWQGTLDTNREKLLENAGLNLLPGMAVKVYETANPGVERTVTLVPISLESIDIANDTVSGTAPVGVPVKVNIWINGQPGNGYREVYADENGIWVADFKVPEDDAYDITALHSADARVLENDSDSTRVELREKPRMDVDSSSDDRIFLTGFTPGGDVAITVLTAEEGGEQFFHQADVHLDAWGRLSDFNPNGDLLPGMFIQAVDQTNPAIARTMVMEALEMAAVNWDENYVHGTAGENVTMTVNAGGPEMPNVAQTVQADSSGNWSFDFDDLPYEFDLVPEGWVNAYIADEDGDRTYAYPRNPPSLGAGLEHNYLHAYELSRDTDYHVTVKRAGQTLFDRILHTDDNGSFWEATDFILQPGDIVQAVNQSTITETETLEIVDLSLDEIDFENDIVRGHAPAGTRVQSWVDPYDRSGWHYGGDVEAGQDGSFTIDYGEYDLQEWMHWDITVETFDGDSDFTRAVLKRPAIINVNWGENAVDLTNFYPNTEVSIEIFTGQDDSEHAYGPVTLTTNGVGRASTNLGDFGYFLQDGDLLRATENRSGGTVKEIRLHELRTTHIDYANEVVVGKAEPGRMVEIFANLPDRRGYAIVQADDEGVFSYDFSQDDIDLTDANSTTVEVYVCDPYGDEDQIQYRSRGAPFLYVELKEPAVEAHNFEPQSNIEIEFKDEEGNRIGELLTLQTDWYGNIFLNAWQGNIPIRPLPGQMVIVRQGSIEKSVVIPNMFVNPIDYEHKLITGWATPDSTIGLQAFITNRGWDYFMDEKVTVSSTGHWSFDYGAAGYDLKDYHDAQIHYFDEDGDILVHNQGYPQGVVADLNQDQIRLVDNFGPNRPVTVKVLDGGEELWSQERVTDALGYLTIHYYELGFDLHAGQTIVVEQFAYQYQKEFETVDVTGAIDPAADTISGSAPAGALIEVWIVNENGVMRRYGTADENGNWSLDFGEIPFDLTASGNSGTIMVDDGSGGHSAYEINPIFYTLTPVASPDTGGTIGLTPLPNGENDSYVKGSRVEMTAQPEDGYFFTEWTWGNQSSDQPVMNFAIEADVTVTAHFDTCHTLTVNASPDGGGSVDILTPYDCGDGYFKPGTVVDIQATASEHSLFNNWTGPVEDAQAATTKVTMDADKSITANFTTCYALTADANPEEGGSVDVQTPANCGAGYYTAGTVVTLEAQPAIGYGWKDWVGPISGPAAAATTVTMDSAKVVTARFAPCYGLTTAVDPDGTGSITVKTAPNCPAGEYLENTPVTIEIVPDEGWGFDGWTGDVAGPDLLETTVTMSADQTVTAELVACYALDVTVVPADGGYVAFNPQPQCGANYYMPNEVVTVTANADMLYRFVDWTGDVTATSPSLAVTMDDDYSLAAHFVTANALTPAAVTLSSPANKALINENAPVALAWNAVASGMTEANRYHVQVGTSTSFSTLKVDSLLEPGVTTLEKDLPDGVYYWRVQAVNMLGYTGNWSPTWSFTLDRSGPAAPSLSSPANAYKSNGVPTFKWSKPSSTVRFEFLLEKESAAGIGDWAEFENIETTATSYKPVLEEAGSFRWSVRAIDAAGNWGNWSAIRSLTINLTPPPKVVVTAPANKLLTRADTLELKWTETSFADGYEVQWAANSSFTTGPDGATTAADELAYTIDFAAESMTDRVYYWHVRGFYTKDDSSKVYGPWSDTRSFTLDTTAPAVPVLSSPANSATVVGTPTYTWKSVSTAYRYEFQTATDASFTTDVHTSALLSKTSYKPPVQPEATYYWHVRVQDQAGNWSNWSATFSVTVKPPTPGKPTLAAPTNKKVFNNDKAEPVFTWSEAAYAESYQLVIATSSGFSASSVVLTRDIAVTDTFNGASFSDALDESGDPIAALPDKTYYWRVRAYNAEAPGSHYGSWSSTFSFTVDTVQPAPPALSSPVVSASAPGGPTVRGVPAFTWKSVSGAVKYRLEIHTDAGFPEDGLIWYETTSTKYTPASQLLGHYYWRVFSIDAAGNVGDASVSGQVTIIAPKPAAPRLTLPTNKYVTSSTLPSFDWSDVPYAVSYELQRSTSSRFTTALKTYPAVDSSALELELDEALPQGVYYWRVRGINGVGEAGSWSSAFTLTIDLTAPAKPKLSSPANAYRTTDTTPKFVWSAVSGASAYQFEIVPLDENDEPLSEQALTITGIRTTSYIPPELAKGKYLWKIRAQDAAGNWGPWSDPRSIEVY